MSGLLPKMIRLEPIHCAKLYMNNGETYTVKEDDMVAIQYINNRQQIVVRRGRVKDIMIVNKRNLHTCEDNVSRIILDCSEQFSIQVLEIKFKDIIKIGGIDNEFDDYSDRVTELKPHDIQYNEDSVNIPVREGGMYEKPSKLFTGNIIGMNPDTGEFEDLE